jgi:Domain of unknown function (DUF4360)
LDKTMNTKPLKTLLILATLITTPIAGLIVAATSSAFATPAPVKLLGLSYGGNGCPAGSASVSVSPDGQELALLFDKFVALGNDPQQSRKSCNISIPIKVPPGFQISLYDAEYRGYVSPKTKGQLRAEYFFAGSRGPVFQRTFNGEANYIAQDNLTNMANVWSKCGDSVNMRVNASMSARGQGMATVSSVALFSRGLVYHIKYRSCTSVPSIEINQPKAP